MTDKMYEFMTPEEEKYTFQSFTMFKHEDSQPCHVWEIKQKSKDKLNLHLVCNTYPVVIDHTLSGPASMNNMAIMYTCQKVSVSLCAPVSSAVMLPLHAEEYVEVILVMTAVHSVQTILLTFQENTIEMCIPSQSPATARPLVPPVSSLALQ